jgi:hypothetical protein
MPVATPMSKMLLMIKASNQFWFTMFSYTHHASLPKNQSFSVKQAIHQPTPAA